MLICGTVLQGLAILLASVSAFRRRPIIIQAYYLALADGEKCTFGNCLLPKANQLVPSFLSIIDISKFECITLFLVLDQKPELIFTMWLIFYKNLKMDWFIKERFYFTFFLLHSIMNTKILNVLLCFQFYINTLQILLLWWHSFLVRSPSWYKSVSPL